MKDPAGRGAGSGSTGEQPVNAGEEPLDKQSFLERLYGDQAKWLIPFVLVIGCVMIYYQSIRFDFINFDDNLYVYRNNAVQQGLSLSGLVWAFTSSVAANWHPLTWLSHQLDITLFGLNPGYHHVMNAVYHALSSVVLFFTMRFLTGTTWRSAIVAAIFAFHPGHVESVAWISERKDVLSGLFFFLTIFAYTKYVKAGRLKKWYALTLILFALGLMAKPMLVTAPFVLLLLDYWPLRRLEGFRSSNIKLVLLEKVPMFLLVIGSSVATFIAQKAGGAVVPVEVIPVSLRVVNAIFSYVKYLGTLFYPVNLAGWYPYPQVYPWWQIIGCVLLLAAITFYAVKHFRDRGYFAVGWFWYLGMLVPVIGLVQVGAQSYADRYTYLPFIGLSIAIVWLVSDLVEKRGINKDGVTAVVLAIIVALGALSFRQAAFWKDTETFYQHTLAITERSFIFELNYCNFLLRTNRLDEAEVMCKRSVASNPEYINAHVSLGVVQMQLGQNEEGLKSFETALKIKPDDVQAFANRINALASVKRYADSEQALAQLETMTGDRAEIDDRLYSTYKTLALALAGEGEKDKAIAYLRKAIALNPGEPDVRSNLGILLYEQGNTDEAYSELTTSLNLNPQQSDIENAVGRILAFQRKWDESIAHFKKALEIDPQNEKAVRNLKEAEEAKKAGK